MEKVTKKSMYEAIVKAFETGSCPFDKADVIAFCQKEIGMLDKKAIKAKERAATKAAEGDALTDIVAGVLTSEYQTIADITVAVAEIDPEATASKVTYRLTQLVKSENAEKTELTIPGGEGTKSRKVQGYRICQ